MGYISALTYYLLLITHSVCRFVPLVAPNLTGTRAPVCRLWAEIFEVREENGQMFWGRMSDDLVPVNVVCIQDTPSTVYQITAYNSLVKKIFDIRLVQPGTSSPATRRLIVAAVGVRAQRKTPKF